MAPLPTSNPPFRAFASSAWTETTATREGTTSASHTAAAASLSSSTRTPSSAGRGCASWSPGWSRRPNVGAAHANIIQPWYPEFEKAKARDDPGAAYSAEVSRLGYIRYKRLPPGYRPFDTLFLHGVCIAIRRQTVEELDYVFDPDFFSYAEDLDLGLRLHALGYRTVVVPRAVVCHLHTLRTRLTPATFGHTVRIVRNRFLSFYKVMPLPEFLLAAPLIALGGPANATEFGLSGPRKLLYGLFLVPVTIAAVFVTAWQLRLFAEKRRRVMARRSRFRCLPEMWRSRPGKWVSAEGA